MVKKISLISVRKNKIYYKKFMNFINFLFFCDKIRKNVKEFYMDSKNIAVIGSGSWGIAISNILAENGHIVNVWSFSKDEKNEINNEHKTRFIPD